MTRIRPLALAALAAAPLALAACESFPAEAIGPACDLARVLTPAEYAAYVEAGCDVAGVLIVPAPRPDPASL